MPWYINIILFLLTWATIALIGAALYCYWWKLGRRGALVAVAVVFLDVFFLGLLWLYRKYAGPGRKVWIWDRRPMPFRRRDQPGWKREKGDG